MRELSLNILDIAQNSIRANASEIEICTKVSTAKQTLTITIRDNGDGMSKDLVASVQDPFTTSRTTRKVGLGIPLFKMAAEQTGGTLTIQSELGKGTCVTAVFHINHIDFSPLGDMGSTMSTLIGMNETLDFTYTCTTDDNAFTLDTKEMREMLQDVPLNSPEIMQWITQYVNENTNAILGGVL